MTLLEAKRAMEGAGAGSSQHGELEGSRRRLEQLSK